MTGPKANCSSRSLLRSRQWGDLMGRVDVPVAILCGGRGTRMGRTRIPKPLVEIGGRPILWHVMKLYASQGFERFILCLGYGADRVQSAIERINGDERWKVEYVDTGVDTNTGGRIKRIQDRIGGTFMATYADGLAKIDFGSLLEHHRRAGRIASLTCTRAQIPFGIVHLGADSRVVAFSEKPRLPEWINGGFFVFEPEIFDHLEDDSVLEKEPFELLAKEGQLNAYLHEEFWVCMDTYKDALLLNDLWESGAPWKLWESTSV